MKIKRLEVELTNRCNLKCPLCFQAHTNFKTKKDLDLTVFEKIDMNEIRFIDMCGNVSEPTCHPEIFKFLDIIAEETQVKIATNGSTHNQSWWRELAKKFSSHRDCYVIFSVDGLEDTHSKYRIGSNYKKLLKNIEGFNSEGGMSFAQFIIFKHNQHQVEDVKKLSKALGCRDTYIRISYAYKGIFEKPDQTEVKTRHEACETLVEEEMHCKHLESQSAFIDFEGEVFPCCLFAGCKYMLQQNSATDFYRKYRDQIDLNTRSLDEILNSYFYTHLHKNYKNIERCQSFCRVADDFRRTIGK